MWNVWEAKKEDQIKLITIFFFALLLQAGNYLIQEHGK